MLRSRHSKQAVIRRGSAILLLALLVIAFVVLAIGARGIKTQMDSLAVANSDNLGWNISQLDVDFRGLTVALLRPTTPTSEAGAAISQAEFNDISKAFDIFYSRVRVVGATLQRIGAPAELEPEYRQIEAVRDGMAATLDAATGPTNLQIDALVAAALTAAPKVRLLTTKGIQALAAKQAEARATQHQIFLSFHAKSFIILGFVLLACLLAIRLWRDLEERSRRVELAATNVTNAIEAALSAVIFTDAAGKIAQCNKAAEAYFGSTRDALVGQDFANAFVHPTSRQAFEAYREEPDATPIWMKARTKEGAEFPIELSGTWEKDVEGEAIFIIYLRDISKQLAAEEKLKASRDEAKQASQAKSRFLATMSHEMRTPLHGLIASLDMIDTKALSSADQRLFETARACSTRALDQVNGVLDHTRTTQSMEKPHPFRPSRIIEDMRRSLTPLAAGNGNTITFDANGDGVGARYVGLPEAFSRVIYNLVGNAIKFTQNGSITIEMIASAGPDDTSRVLHFMVKDTGVGIPETDQSRIFKSFETATAHEIDGARGTGLGLAIVSHSLEQMDAKINLRSTPGLGSQFRFTLHLPLAPQQESLPFQAQPQTRVTPDQACVLVVDDNPVNRIVLSEMVTRLGYSVQSVSSGQEAVDRAAATAFDLILMDINMPGMDGHAAAREISSTDSLSCAATILGVTALIPDDSHDATTSGMHAMLSKPLTAGRLEQAISRHMGAGADTSGSNIVQLMDPNIAHDLKRQSLADARHALDVISDDATSWEVRRNAVHYAVGSTSVVGLTHLSRSLQKAETASLKCDQSALEESAQQIRIALST